MADCNCNFEISFYITSNPWINNGLVRLAHTIEKDFEDKVEISTYDDYITLRGEEDIYEYIAKALKILAIKGTYNFSTAFKIINNDSDASYSPPKAYPEEKDDFKKKMEILDSERAILKKRKVESSKNQKIWKKRMSYLGKPGNYIKAAFDPINTKGFKNLKKFKPEKNVCPICGMPSNNPVDIKEFFNPFSVDHHNNEIEGASSNMRKNAKACPKCTVLSYFSLFDSIIPFYTVSNKATYLALPGSKNLRTLRTICNNLSLSDHYIDFKDGSVTSYSTNIRHLPGNLPSATLLALLNNIVNHYSRKQTEITSFSAFIPVSGEDFSEMVEWEIIEKTKNIKSITHTKVDPRTYSLLKPGTDPKSKSKVYLVPDILCKMSFTSFDEHDIEQFYNALLKINPERISRSLFRIAKQSISKKDRIRIETPTEGHSSPAELFKDIFLPQFMEIAIMLDEETKKACESIAQTIGSAFSKDVGMMTKFAYASNEEDFRGALTDASFRLAKRTALDDKEDFFLKDDFMRSVLISLENETFEDIKNYFISFMSVYAIRKNYYTKKDGKKDKKEAK